MKHFVIEINYTVEIEKIKEMKVVSQIARARLIPEESAREEILAIEAGLKEEILTLKGAVVR